MARNQAKVQAKKIRSILESIGPRIVFRKMHGILNALEMQVEDGRYQRHAVARLCEALLATAELYDIPEEAGDQLEEQVCALVSLVEDGSRG